MSTYYEYQDVKVMIAHKLMSMEGWKVYGYHADESDSMTDYYSPAYWGGVAEKNGYILCVNVYGEAKPQEIRKYNYDGFSYDRSIAEKISKLEAMTVERGASEAEAASAKMMIERLQRKAEESAENREKYIVVGMIPGHMAHPPKMNWHIEKDGIIIAKGNGILKYSQIHNYYSYDRYMEDYQEFKKLGADAWEKKKAEHILNHAMWCDTEEEAARSAKHKREEMEKDSKLIESFESFINKIDTSCGSLLGKGDGYIYEKITVTEYKKELRPVEATNGEIKEGQLFILKSNFNYGCRKGLVYRIHETEYKGKKSYHAYKLNRKYTKECTGNANRNNYWFIGSSDDSTFLKWIEKGSIAWCELQEVKTPYEVEKVVKRKIKAEKKSDTSVITETVQTASVEEASVNNYTYEISEDTDTRNGEKIFLVKIKEKLSRDEYIAANKYMKSLGGYYSRFKHSFLFKENPADKLNVFIKETLPEQAEDKQTESTPETTTEPEKEAISYTITEDQHTQTGNKIWIVKPEKELSKADFTEVKRKFATLSGYYNSFVKGFIFKYNPIEKLESVNIT